MRWRGGRGPRAGAIAQGCQREKHKRKPEKGALAQTRIMRFRKTNGPVFGKRPYFQPLEAKNGALTARFGAHTGSFFVFCNQKQAVLELLLNIR
jgi:hypothetical protein